MRSARKGAFSLECAISNAAGDRDIRGGPPLNVRFRRPLRQNQLFRFRRVHSAETTEIRLAFVSISRVRVLGGVNGDRCY